MFSGTYAPEGWVLCDGATLQISAYEALYALIGTIYGGDGAQTFKVPDLRGRLPIHKGAGPGLTNRAMGGAFGVEQVTLALANIPAHNHQVLAGGVATSNDPTGRYLANSTGFNAYSAAATNVTMNAAEVTYYGPTAPTPHSNIMPGLCVNFIIATNGVFPIQN